jgi:ABC-type nickel/cobalt efflux system permease component RcnA
MAKNYVLLLLLLVFLLPPLFVSAHPMGNFSINHYSKINVESGNIKLKYLIDMAEIPTYQEINVIDTNQDSNMSTEEKTDYLRKKIEELTKGLALELNGEPLELTTDTSAMVFPPGAGGLPTIKITVNYRAAFNKRNLKDKNKVFYRDANYPDRTGWKEIIVQVEEGVLIFQSSVPSEDMSQELTNYPDGTISSPPQDIEANFFFNFGNDNGTTIASADTRKSSADGLVANTPKNSFTQLISEKKITVNVLLFSLLVAFAFGAFHALTPGHGKTIVAAYLVGSRGTAWHAFLLGIIVTITHTIGVFALGLITLYASKFILPEKLYPWLGFASGMIIVGIGMFLFRDRYHHLRGNGEHRHGHSHTHSHHHRHPHHDHEHEYGHKHHHHHNIPENVTLKKLVALGVTGGILPCPEALIVLLSAISLQRIGFGLILILAFSIGLAVVLMAIGLLMVYARKYMEKFSGDGKIMQTLPLLSSVVISVLGFVIAIQSLISGGILQPGPFGFHMQYR